MNINRKNTADTLAQFRRWSKGEIADVLVFSSYVASTPRFVQRNGVDLLDGAPVPVAASGTYAVLTNTYPRLTPAITST